MARSRKDQAEAVEAAEAVEEKAPAKAPDKPRLLKVYSPDGRPFWERDKRHPGGEVWVAGHEDQASEPVEVAYTEAVKRALREGRLAEA